MKIAIYAANFGNYRNEIKHINSSNIIFDKEIDYYFFTEQTNIKSKNWKIVNVPLKPKLDFMDQERHTSKHTKWVVPKILHNYDIIIWTDTKKKNLNKLRFSKEKIIRHLNKFPQFPVFFIKHPCRNDARQELKNTIRGKKENKVNGTIFLNKIKNESYKSTLPDTTCIMLKNKPENFTMMKQCYNDIISNKICRDQNVIQHSWKKTNYESKISYMAMRHINTAGQKENEKKKVEKNIAVLNKKEKIKRKREKIKRKKEKIKRKKEKIKKKKEKVKKKKEKRKKKKIGK